MQLWCFYFKYPMYESVDTGEWKRKLLIALSAEQTVAVATDRS